MEPIHSIVYFAGARHCGPDDRAARVVDGILRRPVRTAGSNPPEPVTAMAFGFSPAMVGRALPDAWSFARPEDVLRTRIEAAAGALRDRLPAEVNTSLYQLSELLWNALAGCRMDGRPLAAAWSAVPRPDDPAASSWLAATIVREHRGDGHVMAAVAAGLGRLDTTLTHVATCAISRGLLQPNRGWSDDEWDQSARRLQAQGILDGDGRLTLAGRALRREVEDTTVRLAAGAVERLGETGVARAIEVATPISRHLMTARWSLFRTASARRAPECLGG